MLNSYVERRMDYLHPLIRLKADAMALALRSEKISFHVPHIHVFETWRSPPRQAEIRANGKDNTRVGAWYSAHQYGLAFDLARRASPGAQWTWQITASEWRIIGNLAKELGLVQPYPAWDPGHIEAPEWPTMRDHIHDLLAKSSTPPV